MGDSMKKILIVFMTFLFLIGCSSEPTPLANSDIIEDVNHIYRLVNDYFPYRISESTDNGFTIAQQQARCLQDVNQKTAQVGLEETIDLLTNCLSHIDGHRVKVVKSLDEIPKQSKNQQLLERSPVQRVYTELEKKHETTLSSIEIVEDEKRIEIMINDIDTNNISKDQILIESILDKEPDKAIVLNLKGAQGADIQYIQEIIINNFIEGSFIRTYNAKVKNDALELLEDTDYTFLHPSYCAIYDARDIACIQLTKHIDNETAAYNLNEIIVDEETDPQLLELISMVAGKYSIKGLEQQTDLPNVLMHYFELRRTHLVLGIDLAEYIEHFDDVT